MIIALVVVALLLIIISEYCNTFLVFLAFFIQSLDTFNTCLNHPK